MQHFVSSTKGLVCAIAVTLAACNTPSKNIYYWGDYQSLIHSSLTSQNSAPELDILKLEADIEKARGTNKAVAPGVYAHLGLLNAQLGKKDIAIKHAQSEKALYPESAVFMDRFMAQLKNN